MPFREDNEIIVFGFFADTERFFIIIVNYLTCLDLVLGM